MSIQRKLNDSARAFRSFKTELRSPKRAARVWSKRLKQLCDSGKARSTSFQLRKPETGNWKEKKLRQKTSPQSEIRNPKCLSPPAGIARIATSTFARHLLAFSVSTTRSAPVLNAEASAERLRST